MSFLSISYLVIKYYPKSSFDDPAKRHHKVNTLFQLKTVSLETGLYLNLNKLVN
jgi:hypothetical protein